MLNLSTPFSSFTLFNTQPPQLVYFNHFYSRTSHGSTTLKVNVSSESNDYSISHDSIVVGCGGISVDFLAAVSAYPNPDDKIRTTNLKIQGGGNVGNALTCVARLGLKPRIISKVANDSQGRDILDELQTDGVDTSFLVVSKEGTSPFTYIIVDNQMKTRTCIHTPGYPPMIPDDLSQSSLLSALHGARIVYFDGRLYETALVVAQEAVRKNIPILIDAEKPREGLDDLLKLADYVVCSAKFPQAWTKASTIPQALVSMLLRLPNIKFVIVTLGKDGCIMIERSVDGPSTEIDIDSLVESLKTTKKETVTIPTCISSSVEKLKAKGIGTVSGRLYIGTAESISPSELIDTTGAGDAFIGAVLYAICAKFSPETMLCFSATVAAAKCRELGARSGLPYRTDLHLASFMQ
ncbi:PREDICTED: ribokinase-like isoform X2 [Lupinus angustifolius]|uniref:ribokinase-like isoform X2 n=1 Tax=Lupinus angustifolius TaxID=3871 RepID=UPI00092F2B8B|nr:PREDICTED: ribokinase-like isoform X2 [Lupinus angustifolius]